MIYLDYAADTPVADKVLEAFCDATKTYIANPNAHHTLGKSAKGRIEEVAQEIATYFHITKEEVIFTSGATESNNLAIKGIATNRRRYGKHMITSYLEHSSVTGPMSALAQEGYEIDYVDISGSDGASGAWRCRDSPLSGSRRSSPGCRCPAPPARIH